MKNLHNLLDRIPVINYHKIETKHDIGITTRTPQQFAEDLRFLHENDYHTLTFKNLLNAETIPDKSVIITFDDAYKSFYTSAYPMLKHYGFSAVVYVPLNYLGRLNDWDVQYFGKKYEHISKEELLEIHKGGMEIGSHTLSHRMLTALDKNEAEKEIAGSKTSLQALLNDDVISISYPFGRFNNTILELSEKAGYAFGVGLLSPVNSVEKYQTLSIKRFNIYRIDSGKTFRKKVEKKDAQLLLLRDRLIQIGGRATNLHQLMKNRGN